jgi:hypothetical protein
MRKSAFFCRGVFGVAFQRKKAAAIGVKAPFPGFVEPALARSIEKKAGLRFKEEAWPHPRKWMLSGGLMSSGSRLASPRAKTTNSTTKPRKSCKRRWIEKTNPAGNNQKRLAHGAAA